METAENVKKWSQENQDEKLEKTRFIFITGKMIRDRMIQTFAGIQGQENMGKECFEVSWPQMQLALILKEKGEASLSEIAQELNVSAPSASAMVDRLVEKGLIEREHSREDRRKVIIRISPKANEHLEEMEKRMIGEFYKLVDQIGPDVTRQWYEVLQKVRQVIDEEKWGIRTSE